MATRDISSPDDNIGVPIDPEMSINNDKIAASFGDVENEVNMEYVKQDIEKERLDQGVMQDIVDNDHNDDESETESANEYVVEKVLDHRFNEKEKLQYLLKWQGWSSEYNSWEDQENIFAEKLITQYWIKKEKLRNSKKRVSSNSLGSSSPKKNRHHDINDNLCGDSTTAENYKDGFLSFQGKGKHQETQTLQPQSTSSQVQQLYSPPSLQRVEPPWWTDPEIQDPKISLDWDKDSVNIEFLELDDQGKIVGYINWKSGSRTGHYLEELHAKCPQKMLEYYKENTHFKLET